MYQQTVQRTNSELIAYYNSVSLPISLAFEYSNPRIISNLIKLIELGRADSLKEAINYMIDDQQKAELIKLQKNAKFSADAAALFALTTFWNTPK